MRNVGVENAGPANAGWENDGAAIAVRIFARPVENY
jgi:hypothetical protein